MATKKKPEKTEEQLQAMETARQLLIKLADLDMEMNILKQQKENAIPEDVRKMLSDIEEEFKPKTEHLQKLITEVENSVRKNVLLSGGTVRGLRVQAVYFNGKVSWNDGNLVGYAVGHPEILALRSVGEPSVQIRRGNGKKQEEE